MDAALSAAIARTLRDFRATSGDAVFDRDRCESALLDMHKGHRGAIRAVLAVIQSGGARRLLAANPALVAATIEREARLLIDDHALSGEYARGAVAAWAGALGLDGGSTGATPGAATVDDGKQGDDKTVSTKRRSWLRRLLWPFGRRDAKQAPSSVPGRRWITRRRVLIAGLALVGPIAIWLLAAVAWQFLNPPPLSLYTIHSTWQRAQGNQLQLVVDGEVHNPGLFTREVPTVWVYLLDRNGFRVGSSRAAPGLSLVGRNTYRFQAIAPAPATADRFRLSFDPP